MANLYVRSTDGSNADNGSTWALAKADIGGAAGIDAAGDVIYVSQAHAESTASAISWAWAGTAASPVKIICGSDAAEPPTAVSTAATVTTTTSGGMNLNNGGGIVAHFCGITFICGSGQASNFNLSASGGSGSGSFTSYKNCNLRIATTGSNASIVFAETALSGCYLENVNIKFAATSQYCQLGGTGAYLTWNGGGIESGSSAITLLFANLSGANRVLMTGVDLSAAASSLNITNQTTLNIDFTMRDCKLPASWSGSLNSGTPGFGSVYRLHNCDSGDTNYRFIEQTQFGNTRSETTIVRSGGASDGTTPISWKMASTANAEYPVLTLDSPEIVQWNDTTGSAITVTVQTVTDGVTLTDAECWLEVAYMGTSGFPVASYVSDVKADWLATAANQATSTDTWTTTGLASPTKQALSVTFTPQEKGYIHATVRLAKASTTVYVDPLLTVT